MEYKIIDSSYDENTNIAFVKIKTNIGNFIGESKLHEEDRKYKSKFVGYRLAESKALINYYKAKVKKMNFEICTIDEIIQTLNAKHEDNAVEIVKK